MKDRNERKRERKKERKKIKGWKTAKEKRKKKEERKKEWNYFSGVFILGAFSETR